MVLGKFKAALISAEKDGGKANGKIYPGNNA